MNEFKKLFELNKNYTTPQFEYNTPTESKRNILKT